ncbi:MAG TPA: BTAD domain-containing putative transcriptional regulator [Candidatus Acidoferrum sp.]|nr:BTAD domain-containing putative transcriptional regulator [Candidatus Acidoferrum sp.]
MDHTLSALDLDHATDVLRTALVERVRAARPAIVSLVAPAGFGKSTFVRQLLESGIAPALAVCDCRGTESDVDLARRLIPALADETPARSAGLSQSETMLSDGHASAPDRIGIALAAWRAPISPSLFVFENTEDAIAEPGARDFIARLLAHRPEKRTIVICSRESLRMHLSRFAPPHQILSLRASDLAFGRSEIAAIFEGSGTTKETIDRVLAVSSGWPIAVLLLARFAHEGRLDPLLHRLDDVAYDELHEYLADQVLRSAPPAITDGLLACAALPHARERDVRLALGDEPYETFLEFQKTSPFVTRSAEGTFSVHPLVASTLLERHPARVDALLAPAAAAYETAGEYQRAAEIHLARHDQLAAAEALDHLEVIEDAAPELAYSRVLASLDRAVVLRYPRLWAVTALLRTFAVNSHALLEEADGIWARLPPDAPPIVRIYLYVFRVLMMSYVGEFERALALVDQFRSQIAAPDVPTTRMHAWLLYLRSLMTARLGRIREAERDFEAAWPFINGMHVMSSGTLVTLAADVARVRGDRIGEREKLERGIEQIRKSGLSNFVAFGEAEATFGAWLAGDDADYTQHAFALEAEVEREGVRGFAFFAACVRGHAGEPQPADHIKWIACGHLIAAASSDDPVEAIRRAELARASAAIYRNPFTQVLAALALAELDPARQRAMRDEAASIATRIDAPELHRAIESIRRGEDGAFLARFVQRYRGEGERPKAGLSIELVRGRVIRDGIPVTLAEREHALLTAVAMRPEALSRERLTDMLWPDLAEGAARNAFHVCLHRLKTRLGDENVVVRSREGYRLGNDVHVDLWEIDRRLATLRASERLGPSQAAALRATYDELRTTRPAKVAGWEWFEPIERHLRELLCEVAQALGKHALAENRPQDALALAHEMIAYDPCDEPAREIAIRAYLASGDRAAALRHFRQYRDTLMVELQCEPSASLARLVASPSS